MSLEARIEELTSEIALLTSAVHDLTSAMLAHQGPKMAALTQEPEAIEGVIEPRGESIEDEAPLPPVEKPEWAKPKKEVKAKAEEPEAEEPKAEKPLDYVADVAPVLTKKAAENRQAVIELLGEFGVRKGSEIPEESLREFLDKLEAL